jgi:predicted Zn finger-like uncharacterized protein
MPFKTKCPGCAKVLDVPDSVVGKRVKCPACAQMWQVPAPTAQTQAAAAPAKAAALGTKCPGCGKAIQVPDSMAGKRVKCPACAHVWQIPGKVVNGQAALGTPGGGLTPAAAAAMKNESFDDMMADDYPIAAGPKLSAGTPFGGASPAAAEPPRRSQKKKKQKSSSSSDDENLTPLDWLLCIFCGNIACIVGIVYLCLGKPKGTKIIVASICFSIVWFIVGFAFGFIRAILENQHHGFH